jgi:hypothetical protein
MESLVKAQSLIVEHAFTIGMVLLAVVLLAVLAWFAMSRSPTKNPTLENKARVNEASTTPESNQLPTQEQLEEMARYREQMESQQAQPQVDNMQPE